jgi:splicing factor 1
MILSVGGEIGHRKYDCPQIKTFNAGIICHRCGQAGHFQRDCKHNPSAQQNYGNNNAGDFDKEYQELMLEVGGGAGYGQTVGRIESGQGNPWQQQPQQTMVSVAPWVCSLSPFL